MAEWAQLRAGPPPNPSLERGHWYRVETRKHDGFVRVLGPQAVGVPTHTDLVRIIDHDPDMVTRVPGVGFQVLRPGEPPPMLWFYGVCPSGHRIEEVGIADQEARCRSAIERIGLRTTNTCRARRPAGLGGLCPAVAATDRGPHLRHPPLAGW